MDQALFHLDAESSELLAGLGDTVIIGIIDRNRGTVRLFESTAVTNAESQRFATHRELVQAGVVRMADAWGFSFATSTRRVRWFNRASVLNREYDDFALPSNIMKELLDVIGLQCVPGFQVYP